MIHDLVIGSIGIPIHAGLDFSQTYESFGGRSLRRAMNGAAVIQSHWNKLRTRISGSGWVPAGLSGLDLTATHTLKCVAPQAIYSASNSIALPVARRADLAPYGFAIVAGQPVETAVSVATNTATLTTVAGATAYQVMYYPQLTVVIAEINFDTDAAGAVFGWTLTAEEA